MYPQSMPTEWTHARTLRPWQSVIYDSSLSGVCRPKFTKLGTRVEQPCALNKFILELQYSAAFRRESKLKTKLLLHNRKLYLTYGMALCLVTLTDVYTHRGGLSAIAGFLVTALLQVCLSSKNCLHQCLHRCAVNYGRRQYTVYTQAHSGVFRP